jgi:hypothetical protein
MLSSFQLALGRDLSLVVIGGETGQAMCPLAWRHVIRPDQGSCSLNMGIFGTRSLERDIDTEIMEK